MKKTALLRSRRGSSSVFICVILSTLVTICFALIYSTIQYTTDSRADALMNLSGQSLLSEFDTDIHQGYGLFMLRSSDRELTSRLKGYLNYTFGQESRVTVSNVSATGAGHTTADLESVRNQILAYMKSGGAIKLQLTGNKSENVTVPGQGNTGSSSGDSGSASGTDHSAAGSGGSGSVHSSDSGSPGPEQSSDPGALDADAGRALRHGPTIASLPSRQLPKQDLLSKAESLGARLTDLSEVFTDGTSQFLLGSYVLGMFNDNTYTADADHFFYRETEYILNGELTDQENRNKTKGALKMLRFASNLEHIWADPEKREAVIAASEVISPGLTAAIAQAALSTAWAYAESANDAELLLNGYRVPLVKDSASWAMKLENVIEDTAGDKMVHPRTDKGLTYRQYLRMLLFLEGEDVITARIMDLIQINMRKNVDGDFLISECCMGLNIGADINGRKKQYDVLYQKE